MIQGLNPKTKKIESTLGVLGQDDSVRMSILNMQDSPRESYGKFLSGGGAATGSLPRQPAPNTLQYLRTPREDVHAAMRPPEAIGRGHTPGALTEVPLSRLPRYVTTFR